MDGDLCGLYRHGGAIRRDVQVASGTQKGTYEVRFAYGWGDMRGKVQVYFGMDPMACYLWDCPSTLHFGLSIP